MYENSAPEVTIQIRLLCYESVLCLEMKIQMLHHRPLVSVILSDCVIIEFREWQNTM